MQSVIEILIAGSLIDRAPGGERRARGRAGKAGGLGACRPFGAVLIDGRAHNFITEYPPQCHTGPGIEPAFVNIMGQKEC